MKQIDELPVVETTKHSSTVPVTVAYGDGIGPELMEATLRVLTAAGAKIAPEVVEIGEKVYDEGFSAGIKPEAWDSLRRTKVFLKAPITTPQGGGFKSLNVTVRKTLGLFANVRPCIAYHPYVRTLHRDMDVVVIRENEEDLYAGIEHRQTDEVYQCLKLVSRPGTERVIRYAFEYARANGRKKITCMTKDNIMKLTDGLFHKVFEEVGAEYPDIEQDHWIIDIGMARAANRPQNFDVIVTPNLYGDILSDVTAEAAGSVGMAGSANIGRECAMFEAIHGSAPKMAGKDRANPSGLLTASTMMLAHIGQADTAELVQNAWLKTLEDGIHTADIFELGKSAKVLGTSEFASAIIDRLGEKPEFLKPAKFGQPSPSSYEVKPTPRQTKELYGVDVFVCYFGDRETLAQTLQKAETAHLPLQMITNRGVKVWPNGHPETFCTDHWRCRFLSESPVAHDEIVTLLKHVSDNGLDFIKTENLCYFDGEPGFSLGQGQ